VLPAARARAAVAAWPASRGLDASMSSILRINSTPPCALAGAWNRRSALLFVDQPIGAGFSVPGAFSRCGPSSATLDCLPLTRCCQNQQRCRIGTFAMHCFAHERHVRCVWSLLVGAGRDIPRDELTLAADLYAALQAFFLARPCLQQRPLVIAGESYAGGRRCSASACRRRAAAAPGAGCWPAFFNVFILGLTAERCRFQLLFSSEPAFPSSAALNLPRDVLAAPAGKYVPSIGHFILQQAARHNASLSLGAPRAIPSPAKTRKLPPALAAARPLLSRPPLFDLRALAIGNGLTDPAVQVGCDVEL
jgi:hypothetical protein